MNTSLRNAFRSISKPFKTFLIPYSFAAINSHDSSNETIESSRTIATVLSFFPRVSKPTVPAIRVHNFECAIAGRDRSIATGRDVAAARNAAVFERGRSGCNLAQGDRENNTPSRPIAEGKRSLSTGRKCGFSPRCHGDACHDSRTSDSARRMQCAATTSPRP